MGYEEKRSFYQTLKNYPYQHPIRSMIIGGVLLNTIIFGSMWAIFENTWGNMVQEIRPSIKFDYTPNPLDDPLRDAIDNKEKSEGQQRRALKDGLLKKFEEKTEGLTGGTPK